MKTYILMINGIDAVYFIKIEDAQKAIKKLKSYNTNVNIILKTC